MNNTILKIPEQRLYKLPFRSGSKILDRNTLDANSDFRTPKRGYLTVSVSKVSFKNEILTSVVTIEKECPEKVYIMIKDDHLLISCSTDTDFSYMSRHAYLFLDKLLWYYNERSFDDYYYPDFFDETGNSKYITTSKERGNFIIRFRRQYANFFRPGTALPSVTNDSLLRLPYQAPLRSQPEYSANQRVLAYCVLNPINRHKSEEYKDHSMLIPFTATLNLAGTALKSLTAYLIPFTNHIHHDISDTQDNLNDICSKMLKTLDYYFAKQYGSTHLSAREKKETLFALWKKPLPLLSEQHFIYYQDIYHLRYIKGKPVKKDIEPCVISNAIPRLDFTLRDKGDYYTFELKFIIGKKRFRFANSFIPRFFAVSDKNPKLLYLLGSLADSELVSFFSGVNFKLPILKKHYEEYFITFVEQIKNIYGVNEK